MTEILLSGFTFIKNGLTLGYPTLESILSIEPICDEVIINVGFEDRELTKDDGTYNYLKQHLKGTKFIFLKSWWNPDKMKNGEILAEQTNIALSQCRGKYCQYIQGDECVHEEDISNIKAGIDFLENNPTCDALVFNFIHFYGDVNIIKQTRTTYRREIRLIRNGKNIKSWKDAQGFRSCDDCKLKSKLINARILHYGWARKEQIMDRKNKKMNKYYHGEEFEAETFSYNRMWGLKEFNGTHPLVMKKWIETHRNNLQFKELPFVFKFHDLILMISDFIEFLTGVRVREYTNYKLYK